MADNAFTLVQIKLAGERAARTIARWGSSAPFIQPVGHSVGRPAVVLYQFIFRNDERRLTAMNAIPARTSTVAAGSGIAVPAREKAVLNVGGVVPPTMSVPTEASRDLDWRRVSTLADPGRTVWSLLR